MTPSVKRVTLWTRICCAARLLVELRKPDFQAAGTFVKKRYVGQPWVIQWCRFIGWSLRQLFIVIPDPILPIQEQAASGDGGPETMRLHVGISGSWFFAGHYDKRVLFGSGGSRVRDHEAGRNRPSRFLTKFLGGEMKQYYGPYQLGMTNEWSGTVRYTPDEYPVVGLVDGKRHYIIGGMCGSGSAVSFNGDRCVCNRILGITDDPDNYPESYFSPTRLLDPRHHHWPELEADG